MIYLSDVLNILDNSSEEQFNENPRSTFRTITSNLCLSISVQCNLQFANKKA